MYIDNQRKNMIIYPYSKRAKAVIIIHQYCRLTREEKKNSENTISFTIIKGEMEDSTLQILCLQLKLGTFKYGIKIKMKKVQRICLSNKGGNN